MIYFRKILQYAKPYKLYAILNVIFNIFYAIFSALSFYVLMPLLQVIFGEDQNKEVSVPVYSGFTSLGEYMNDSFSFYMASKVGDSEEQKLIIVIALILIVITFKNVFSYLGFYAITFLKNGVLKDIRNDLYQKIISLPISYFSEKRKEM